MGNANAAKKNLTCGEKVADHLFVCPLLPIKCRKEDFLTHEISDKAIQITAYLEGKGI